MLVVDDLAYPELYTPIFHLPSGFEYNSEVNISVPDPKFLPSLVILYPSTSTTSTETPPYHPGWLVFPVSPISRVILQVDLLFSEKLVHYTRFELVYYPRYPLQNLRF